MNSRSGPAGSRSSACAISTMSRSFPPQVEQLRERRTRSGYPFRAQLVHHRNHRPCRIWLEDGRGATGRYRSSARSTALDQRGSLARLDPQGSFVPVPFPGGSGIVREVRHEGMVTFSRPLGAGISLQVAGGGEFSTLERVDGDSARTASSSGPRAASRSAGGRTSSGISALKLRRRVGQISFYDFLAQPNLKSERENAGNPQLVPPQSWEAEMEVGPTLGAAGKTLAARLLLRSRGHRRHRADRRGWRGRRQSAAGDALGNGEYQHDPVRAAGPARRAARRHAGLRDRAGPRSAHRRDAPDQRGRRIAGPSSISATTCRTAISPGAPRPASISQYSLLLSHRSEPRERRPLVRQRLCRA